MCGRGAEVVHCPRVSLCAIAIEAEEQRLLVLSRHIRALFDVLLTHKHFPVVAALARELFIRYFHVSWGGDETQPPLPVHHLGHRVRLQG